jgi:predicted transcriptional regulator
MMIFRSTPDGKSFLMITTDVEQPGKISMQHATTLDTVTISVSAPK